MTTTPFTKIGPNKYAVEIVNDHNRTRRILVRKVSVSNPSARGGAYMDRWEAYNGGMYLREFGDTRQQAFDRALAVVAKRGFRVA